MLWEGNMCRVGNPIAKGRRNLGTKHRSQRHRSSGEESFFFMKESGLYFPEGRVAPLKGFMQTSDQIRLVFQRVRSGWEVWRRKGFKAWKEGREEAFSIH